MKVYNLIRKDVEAVIEDVPQSENIRKVTEILKSNSIEI
jgi:histidine ammonia-lyase